MEYLLVILVAAAVLAGAAFLGWYSVQSLLQGSALSRPLPLHELKENLDRDVAVSGRPELEAGHAGPFGRPVLWYKHTVQEYRRSGRSSRWRTVAENVRHAPFFVHFPRGGRVRVTGEPSEVHGTSSRTDGGGFFAHHGQRRTIHRWLPVPPRLTVLGRLGLSAAGATVMPSPRVGLLLTPAEPARAALRERLKGACGLAACALLLAGLVAFLATVLG